MPIVTDATTALAYLDSLPARVLRGAENGLADIAPVVADVMQNDPVHGNVTGAAHASYFAAPLGGTQEGQGVVDAAFTVAQTAIASHAARGLTGHGGQAARIAVPTVGEYERGLLMGSPVDYAEALAQEDRSPVVPTLQQYAGAIERSVADGIKGAL
jgi:hypothetical protein